MDLGRYIRFIGKYVLDSDYRFEFNANCGMFSGMNDEKYLKRLFKIRMGYDLDLTNPKTFSEKLQWMKLYDHNPLYTKLVDKYAVREYVTERIGGEYLIPLLGVWDDPDEIDFEALPNQFVLKCNHNSGLGMCICKNKSELDVAKTKAELRHGLKEDYFAKKREWPYKNVPRRIICEKYMEDDTAKELTDYKFFTFNGEVKALFVATERQKAGEETKFDFFDSEYVHLDLINGHPNASRIPPKPRCFEEMKRIASALSNGLPHVRVDLYEVNGRIYFGELTLTHWSGLVPYVPSKWDRIFGDWFDLPKV